MTVEDISKVMEFEVIEPRRVALRGLASGVFLPGAEGEIGILYNHMPLLVKLGLGLVRVHTDEDKWAYIAVNGGYAQVRDNQVIVLADEAVSGEEVKVADEETALERLAAARLAAEEVGAGADRAELDQRMAVIRNRIRAAHKCSGPDAYC